MSGTRCHPGQTWKTTSARQARSPVNRCPGRYGARDQAPGHPRTPLESAPSGGASPPQAARGLTGCARNPPPCTASLWQLDPRRTSFVASTATRGRCPCSGLDHGPPTPSDGGFLSLAPPCGLWDLGARARIVFSGQAREEVGRAFESKSHSHNTLRVPHACGPSCVPGTQPSRRCHPCRYTDT